MIRQEDIRKLTDSDIEATKRIYDELMRNGISAVPLIPPKGKLYAFSKLCYDLIHQYILWKTYRQIQDLWFLPSTHSSVHHT